MLHLQFGEELCNPKMKKMRSEKFIQEVAIAMTFMSFNVTHLNATLQFQMSLQID